MSRAAEPSDRRSTQPSSAGAKPPTVGGAFPAQPDRVIGARQPALRNAVAWVQIGPMRGDLEPAVLRGDQDVFVCLGCGQRAGRIPVDEIIFEHIFNIRSWAAIPRPIRRTAANGQLHVDPDNT
jgi:hypothetical protein